MHVSLASLHDLCHCTCSVLQPIGNILQQYGVYSVKSPSFAIPCARHRLPLTMEQQTPMPPESTPPTGAPMHPQKHAKWIIIGALLLAIVIATLVFLYVFRGPVPEIPAEPVEQEDIAPLLEPEINSLEEVADFTVGRPVPDISAVRSPGWRTVNEHVIGNPDARISLVEYTDFGNRFARLLHPELMALVERNQDVNWAYRHFPVEEIKQSYPASSISECVWFLMDDDTPTFFFQYVLENSGLNPQTETDAEYRLGAYAMGVPPDELNDCLSQPWVERVVKDHKRLGIVQGNVSVTPTFMFYDNLNGETRVVPGVDTIEYFERVIAEMMQRPVED